MTDWKPGDIANGHMLGIDGVWRRVEEPKSGGRLPRPCPRLSARQLLRSRRPSRVLHRL